MTTIFDEFRHIAPSQCWIDVIDLLEHGSLEQREKKELALKLWRACKPAPPSGYVHAVNSDWRKLEDRAVVRGLYDGAVAEPKASYMRMLRGYAATWPPVAKFQKATPMPAPSDWRDGANGWTPRKG